MKKKKLKSSIPLWIASFLFVSSWVVFGVAMALKTVNVGLNGDISFTATNVYALVTGSITGTATTNTLEDINIEASTTESELGWNNKKFDFKDETTPIVVTINVKNLSEERALYLVISENITENNTIVTRNNGINGDNNFPAVITVAGGQTHTIEITLKVNDKNKSVSDKFALNIELNSEEIKQTSDYSTLTFATLDTTAKTMSVSSGTTTPTGDLVIPAEVLYNNEVYKVTEVADNAFKDNTNITGITFPSTLTKIGESAFEGTSIQSLDISRNIFLSSYAFKNCKSLKSLIFDNNQASQPWAGSVFEACTALESVTIKEGMTTIQESLFTGCTSLKSITLPNSLTALGPWAFCDSGLESIIIPANVKQIKNACFGECYNLKSVTFENPEGWTSNGESLDLSDPEQNATFFKTTYRSYDWTRS